MNSLNLEKFEEERKLGDLDPHFLFRQWRSNPEMSQVITELIEFRELVTNESSYTAACLICRQLVLQFIRICKPYIESIKNPDIMILVKVIRRTTMQAINLITNMVPQLQSCRLMLKELHKEILDLGNMYLEDYFIGIVLDELLSIYASERAYAALDLTWGIANFLAVFFTDYDKAYAMYKGFLGIKCIYTLPIFVKKSKDMSKEQFLELIGKDNDEYDYEGYKRVEGFVRLHLAILVTLNESREIWSYIANTLNNAEKDPACIHLCLIFTWLDVCYSFARETFGGYYYMLMGTLRVDIMPKLMNHLNKANLPAVSYNCVAHYIQRIYYYIRLFEEGKDELPSGILIPNVLLTNMS